MALVCSRAISENKGQRVRPHLEGIIARVHGSSRGKSMLVICTITVLASLLQLRFPLVDAKAIQSPVSQFMPSEQRQPSVVAAAEEIWLETRQPSDASGFYPARSAKPLGKGKNAKVTVSGTYSAWMESWWQENCKGVPEAKPQFPTQVSPSGPQNGPVGLDAEFMFASPKGSIYCTGTGNPPTPSKSPFQVSMDNGVTWTKPPLVKSGYMSNHIYAYLVQGLSFPLQFRIDDFALEDNYGRLKITVEEVAAPAQPTALPTSYTFPQTGFTVSARIWETWQGAHTFEESLFINGYPITNLRSEVSPTDGKTYQTQWFERARFEQHPENKAPNDVLLGLLGASAAQSRQNEGPFKVITNPGSGLQWFRETQHTLGDASGGGRAIAAVWSKLGGLPQFGYPISQPFMEKNREDGKSYLVQYFQRQRFEYHPENKSTSFEVLLGRLGTEQVGTKTANP